MSLAEKELLRKYLLVGYWFCFCFVFFFGYLFVMNSKLFLLYIYHISSRSAFSNSVFTTSPLINSFSVIPNFIRNNN